MNILLTGSTGYFGKTIENVLSNSNTIFNLIDQNGKHLRLENHVPIFNQIFDLVIHAAGKAHVIALKESDKIQFFEVNVNGTNNLLKGLELFGVPKQFVFISSVSVYGKDYGNDINENCSLLAKDPYGQSKILAEQMVLDWCHKNNVKCTILRLPLIVGKNPPGNLGAMIRSIENSYYFNIDGGVAKKSMVLAHDVANFIPIISSIGGIYNLTDGVHPNFIQISSLIAKKNLPNLPLFIAKFAGYIGDLIGNKSPINSLKIKKIISNLTFDDSKARSLGWQPNSVLEFIKHNGL